MRIKLERTKGWHMPANTLKVDRSTRWGNPFKVSETMSAEAAVKAFERHLQALSPEVREALLAPLRGKNLACWCELDAPCHADVWLKWANNLEVGK